MEQRGRTRENIAKSLVAIVALGACVAIAEQDNASLDNQPAIVGNCLPANAAGLPRGDEYSPTAKQLSQEEHVLQGTTYFASAEQNDGGITDATDQAFQRQAARVRRGFKLDSNKAFQKELTAIDDVYNRQNAGLEEDAKNFLNSNGISISVAKNAHAKDLLADDSDNYNIDSNLILGTGANSWLLPQLADLPESLIRASGLRHVVVIRFNNTDTTNIPRHGDGTIYVTDSYDVSSGIAALVLDNCPDKATILQRMVEITEASGHNYDPDFKDSFSNKGIDNFSKKYQNIFSSQDAIRSPENEFVEMFSDAMSNFNFYSDKDLNKPVGKKQQLAQAVFNKVVPGGSDFEVFYDIEAGNYGTQGLDPYDLVNYFKSVTNELDHAKTQTQRNNILQVIAGNLPPSVLLPPKKLFSGVNGTTSENPFINPNKRPGTLIQNPPRFNKL